jgi:dihydropteroate synthase
MYKQPRSVQVVVFRETLDGREYLLLLRRTRDDEFWQPVSGSLEEGETDEAAARRETFEETGIAEFFELRDIGLVSQFVIAPAWREKYAPGVLNNVQASFAARVGNSAIAMDEREHVDFGWFSAEEAVRLVRYAPNARAIEIVESESMRTRRRSYDLRLPSRVLELGRRTLVMGVLNVTPDSFSDGGRFVDLGLAVEHALAMEAAGADLIDVGGESSRPGSDPVSEDEEMRRVVPVVGALATKLGAAISIDTTRASTARAALDAGATIVNDISALRFDPELATVAASAGAGLILMHMRGSPKTMQTLAPSEDIVSEVERDLLDAVMVAQERGVPFQNIVLDPGIGFGKTVAQNVELIARLGQFARLDRPILVGTSRKSFLGKLTGRETGDRLAATVASVTAAVLSGAHIVRVHDVAEAVDAVRVADAVFSAATR